MPPSRGYRNYRGRTSKGKIVLAVLLVLIILAALSVLAMQRYVVYDENGTPFLRLPEKEPEETVPQEPPPEEDIQLEVIIPEPEIPPVRMFSLPGGALTREIWEAAAAEAGTEYGGAVVTLKDQEGTVYFDSAVAVRKAVKVNADTMEILAEMTGREDFHTVARFSCLLDPRASRTDVKGMGLRNTGGYIFYDGNYTAWLDPGKAAAREYLCVLAREIAELGFDEILLTEVSYPTVGKIDKINYDTDVPIEENIGLLLEDLRTALEPYQITLSIELPEAVIMEGADQTAGLQMSRIVGTVDRIYAVTEPGRAALLSDLALQTEGAAGNRVRDFVPELSAPDPEWEGDLLVIPGAEE